jgi:hypothetical protein
MALRFLNGRLASARRRSSRPSRRTAAPSPARAGRGQCSRPTRPTASCAAGRGAERELLPYVYQLI